MIVAALTGRNVAVQNQRSNPRGVHSIRLHSRPIPLVRRESDGSSMTSDGLIVEKLEKDYLGTIPP